MRKFYATLSFACFVWILGSEGALMQETVSFGRGVLGMFLGLAGMIFFADLAGIFGRRSARVHSRRVGQRVDGYRSR